MRSIVSLEVGRCAAVPVPGSYEIELRRKVRADIKTPIDRNLINWQGRSDRRLVRPIPGILKATSMLQVIQNGIATCQAPFKDPYSRCSQVLKGGSFILA